MSDLSTLSIAECGRRYRDGSLSPVAVTEAYLARIAAVNDQLHGFNTVTADIALEAARTAEAELAQGTDRGPMHGIPFGVKDIVDTAGVLTSCQSRLKEGNVPAEDATLVAKLKAAGAVMLGKTATIEFATGGPSDETLFPPARNPWNPEHVPGGSSSGSGASVAAGLCRMAVGTDTGGSIRGPAALCGTVGIKPTYGRVSRRGVHPLSFTLDNCGPLAATVEDAAISLGAMAGFDPLDPASANEPVPDYAAALTGGIEGLKVGFVRGWAEGADAEVIAALEAAAALMAELGAEVEEVSIPDEAVYHACGRTILMAECFAVHEHDLVHRPELYGRPTRERLMVGAFIRGSDYVEAMRMRREMAMPLNNSVLARHDLLLTPAALRPAGRFDGLGDDPLSIAGMTTIPFNVTGNPAMTMPCGFAASGLPLSMQIVGRAFDEATVFRLGHTYEQATGWTARRPAMAEMEGEVVAAQ
jgi:aspartyl-tRNA(Asn)/glutamyl-tRNA(Gln) amidotransferase subunit A